MNLTKLETVDGKLVLTVEFPFLFLFKKTRKFLASEERVPNKYWTWVELPNKTLVPDRLSFQLDYWARM